MIERPDNLTDLVFAAIRQRLVDASLPPGSSVSEAMLSKDLQVSKTPVREALLRLRHIGLVETTSRGLRVVMPTARAIRDAFELRAGLEAAAAQYAAARATAAQTADLVTRAQQTLDVAKAFEEFRQADQEFHLAVAEAADNRQLRSSIEDALVLTQVLRQRDVTLERDFVPDAKEHVRIARSSKTGDGAAAAERLSSHILRIMDQLLEAFAQEPEQATAGLRSLV